MSEAKVEFIDTSQECIIEMSNLAKKGLRSAGKIVTKILREKIPVKTGGLKKSICAEVSLNKKTHYIPRLRVGYLGSEEMAKKGFKHWVNPSWFEFGTKPHVIMTREYSEFGKSSYELMNSNGQKFGVMVQHPGMSQKNFLRNTVYDNISEIRAAEEEYLSKITDIVIEQGLKMSYDEGDEEVD